MNEDEAFSKIFRVCPLCAKEKHITRFKKIPAGKTLRICKKCFIYLRNQTSRNNKRCSKKKVPGKISAIEWAFALEFFKFGCVRCGHKVSIEKGNRMTIDHVVPISKGGTNTSDNIQPMCRSCNMGKDNNNKKKFDYRHKKPQYPERFGK